MKKTNTNPRFKLQRRLLTELPGLGKAGAMERRPYPPGQHGQRRKKYSEYGLQLEEKQKIRHHYGLKEEQLLRFIGIAKRKKQTTWTEALVNLLEKRLDNLVFRLGFAPSIPAAKQLISHGKVYVNGKRVTISSAILSVKDEISLKESAYQNQVYLQARQSPRLPLADFLEKRQEGEKEIGRLIDEPKLTAVPFNFDSELFTSYYSM
jgi:small subunit ribosomal protein S4